ncbi:helix-turn-helix transcriptional regulator [Lacimicrobium alkaliphilum]|uniref:HTH araC/xylS-type domain-containing protein n=1 Tax=Lacimicrobium alkaliphilum TaxID=1526571 RepID=A0ABQ1QWK7_9ALTE|nr:helix-turn-helix domain-containing protein [Lacimicrobium alkaliphilum]GGD49847.1 hypothetical protein GCM10011357_02170 [Lacimicrobium alkaliphilum]
MISMTPYQILVIAALILWLVPLMLIWARFDRLPHGREMLLVVLLSPALLIETSLCAFEMSTSWHFLVAVFSALPALLTSLLCLAVTRLLLDKTRYSARLMVLPGILAVLLSVPLLFFSSEYKSAVLTEGVNGQLAQHWYVYGYTLLCQLSVLWQAFAAENRLREYQFFLSDQVVDTHLYRFSISIKVFGSLITLAFCVAVAIILVAVTWLPLSQWLQIMQVCYFLIFIVLSLVLMEKRRYSPSPLDYARLQQPDYPEEQLRDALTQAEQAMLKHKAYKKIGLRLKDFSRATHVDPTLLAAAMRTLLKRNFRAFVYHYRLEYAKRILMRSDVRVSDVARRLGFDSERFLSELFVKYVHKMARDEDSRGHDS